MQVPPSMAEKPPRTESPTPEGQKQEKWESCPSSAQGSCPQQELVAQGSSRHIGLPHQLQEACRCHPPWQRNLRGLSRRLQKGKSKKSGNPAPAAPKGAALSKSSSHKDLADT